MKISLMLALILLAAAPAATAIVNPEDNVVGPYFDQSADLDCLEGVEPNAQLPIYIILTHPTFDQLYGFELGLDYDSNLILLGQDIPHSGVINVGNGDSIIAGFGSPTRTSEATLLVTLTMLHVGTADSPSYFNVQGSSPSSLDPAYPTVLLAGGELLSTGLHSTYRPYTYLINGRCGFEDEELTWDTVKTLYRR